MFSHKSKYLSKAFLVFVISTFFVYSLQLCYVFFALELPNSSVQYCYLYGVPLSIASNMRSEALAIMPHFGQANFYERTKSMPFFLRQIARLKYDVMNEKKLKQFLVVVRSLRTVG